MKTKLYFLIVLFALGANGLRAQWEEQVHPSYVDKIFCLDANNCYAYGNQGQGYIYKTIDGQTWTDALGDLSSPDGVGEMFCFENDICVANNGGFLYKTINGGLNWVAVGNIELISSPNFIDENLAFGFTLSSGIVKSTDGGQNWNAINQPPLNSLPFFLNENFGFASTNFQIFKTINGGANWTKVYDVASNDSTISKIQIINSNVAYGIGIKGNIIKTENGGDTWTVLNNPYLGTNMSWYSLDFIDEKNGYFGGSGSQILKTIDGGQSWIDESYTFQLAFRSVQIADMNTVYISGTNYILKNDSANFVGLFDLNQHTQIGKLYPNPTQGNWTIELNEQNLNGLTLTISDCSGKQLSEQNINTPKQSIQRGNLSDGIYFIQVKRNGNPISIQKITLQ